MAQWRYTKGLHDLGNDYFAFCSRVEVDQQGLLHEMMSSKSDVDDVTDSLQARVFDRDSERTVLTADILFVGSHRCCEPPSGQARHHGGAHGDSIRDIQPNG